MKLKYKITLPVLLVFAFFIGLFFILNSTYKNDIETINNNRGLEFNKILYGLIDLKTQSISSYVEDNSYWDEMVAFVKTNNQKWLEDTILPSYKNFGIDYLIVFNADSKLVREIKNNEEYKNLSPYIIDAAILDNKKSFSDKFFLKVGGHIAFVHVTTIHYTIDEHKKNKPEGFLVGAKIVNDSFITNLTEISNHNIEFYDSSKKYDLVYELKDYKDETISRLGVKLNNSLSNIVLKIFDKQLFLIVTLGIVLFLMLLFAIHIFIIIPFLKIANALSKRDINYVKHFLSDKSEIGDISRLILETFDRQDKIEIIYTTDTLTGLGNRTRLLADLKKTKKPALALLDIDRFGNINDFYGSNIGDIFIKEFSNRIFTILDGKYSLYRLGGDQFVILADSSDTFIFELEIEKIMAYIIGQHLTILSKEIPIQVTVGISFENQDDILQSADMALNQAKKTKKHIMIYNKSLGLEEEYKKNIEWSLKIKKALQEDRIVPFYQPIYNNATDQIDKYECLVRMIDEDGTIISPYSFLDIAKKSKQYIEITKRVVIKSFEKFKCNDKEFSINITIEDILSDDFRSFLEDIVKKDDCVRKVVFEIVESEGIENFDEVIDFIATIKDYGFKIAIDDFGTGYSNFEYLLKLNSDFIKIDGSIIKNIDTDNDAKEIVKTIIDFAKKKDLQVVAEFVATKEILEIVKELGIEYSQGYYLSQPVNNIL